MRSEEWLLCPVCQSKTRLKIREDTELKKFPLFCPKCKRETIAISWGYDITSSYEYIPSIFAKDVRLRINGIIDNDRNNLLIKDEAQIKDYNVKSRLSDREWRSGEEAKRLFLAGRTPDDVIFDSHYKIDEYSRHSFISKPDYLNIISDYDGAVERPQSHIPFRNRSGSRRRGRRQLHTAA